MAQIVKSSLGPNSVNKIFRVWLSNGDGRFAKKEEFELEKKRCDSVAIGDFNGDGLSDFFYKRLRLSKGDGSFFRTSFEPPRVSGGFHFATPTDVYVTGDFNADGLTDLVLTVMGEDGAAACAMYDVENHCHAMAQSVLIQLEMAILKPRPQPEE